MMRVCFERLAGAPDEATLRDAFAIVAAPFGMQWEMHDARCGRGCC